MNEAPGQQGRWLPLFTTALLSSVLFYSGFFTFLFAVPIQVAFSRRGERNGIYSAVCTGLFIFLIHGIQAARVASAGSVSAGLYWLDILMPFGMMAGLSVFNVLRRYPWWTRLLIGAGIAVIAAFPSIRFIAAVDPQTGEASEQLRMMLSMMGVDNNLQIWADLVRRIVLSSIGPAFTAGIAANWWLGSGIALRSTGAVISLRKAHVPDGLIWVVISGLAVIVTTWVGDIPSVAPVGWNLMLVGCFLFSIQGLGVIQSLLHRRGVGALGERWVLTIALIALFLPGLNILVAGGLPLFGMSELWIDYKRGEHYESNTE